MYEHSFELSLAKPVEAKSKKCYTSLKCNVSHSCFRVKWQVKKIQSRHLESQKNYNLAIALIYMDMSRISDILL